MVLFWCRMKQAQFRALSNQFKRCYFQIHGSSAVIRETRIGVVNSPSLDFHKTGSKLGNYVRFYAAPVLVNPKYEEKDKGRPRMNEQISAQYVRLVTDEGHGVVSRHEALERARRLNVDLVEVQPDGNPPVCKLMDYNKEMYIRQAKEKEQTKKKSDLVLRKGAMKEVRITCKIDKNDLQTKADTVKRLAERGHRVKCMAVGTADQDLGGLLSRLSVLIDDFTLVESGPRVEAKQAYIVVRHVKFGPLKKGPGKRKVLALSNGNTSTESPEKLEQSLDESDLETEVMLSDEAIESDSPDDFDVTKNKTCDHMRKFATETSNGDITGSENRYAPTGQKNASATALENRYAATRQTNASAPGSENRHATTRQTNASNPGARRRFDPESQNPASNWQFDLNRQGPSEPKLVDTEVASSSRASSYGMFGTLRPNNDPHRESGPVEVNRYKKGPNSQPPPSDYHINRGARRDFSRENSNTNPDGIREKQAGFRR